MADVAILVPVLRRPWRPARLVDSITSATPEGAYRIVFVATENDEAEQRAVRATGADLLVLPGERQHGDYARKMNYAYRRTAEPLMLLAGDDVVFHPGWLEAAARLMVGPIGVVGTQDTANKRVLAGEHSTHSMVSRRYADERGTVDGPGQLVVERYGHQFVDDELVGTAKKRGAWAFANDSVVEHRHPNWGTEPMDEVYALGKSTYRDDRALFICRQGLWA